MSECFDFKVSANGIRYLDFSDILNTPCGTVLRNDKFSRTELKRFILGISGSEKTDIGRKPFHKLRLVELNQKHTPVVIRADDQYAKSADGAYANSSNYVMVIKTADCFPVFLYDGTNAGLLHVGWRGAFMGIIENFFRTAQGFDCQKAKAVLGPGIGPCCLKVSPEVALLFDKKYRQQRKTDFYIDLEGLIIDELTRFGVKYILSNHACTVCDSERFYSYRREGKKVKKMLSFICTEGG
jgi:YfiH family protein